jgi:hypothetical protein
MFDLMLFGMADADHHFLYRIGRVFRHIEAGARRDQHRDPAGLAEFQRADRVLVDEGLFDSRRFVDVAYKFGISKFFEDVNSDSRINLFYVNTGVRLGF